MPLKEILSANDQFIKNWVKEHWETEQEQAVGAIPAKKLAVFACMDTRLVEMMEKALGLQRGDAKIIKNAGTVYSEDVVRSLVAAVFTLGVTEILVVVHHDCGIAKVSGDKLKSMMLKRGIDPEALEKVDLEKWMGTFRDYRAHVEDVVTKIRKHPFIPKDIPIHGLLFCPDTGEVEVVVKGYKI